MKVSPSVVDENAPISEFLTKMQAAHQRRLAAVDVADKRAIDREVAALMAQYFGGTPGSADQVAADVRRSALPKRPRFSRPSKYSGDSFDHKLAASGERADD